jgi:hypothetical protein
MPLWKPVEILALNTIISMPLPEDVLLSRINCIGCIPRDIFTTSFTSQVIDGAIVTFDASYIVRYVVGGVLPDDGVFSHKLVHVNSHQPFTRDNAELEFASDIVGKKIYEKIISDNKENIINVINQLEGKTISSSLRGMLFAMTH